MSESRTATVEDFRKAMRELTKSFDAASATFRRQMQTMTALISNLNSTEPQVMVSWRYTDV